MNAAEIIASARYEIRKVAPYYMSAVNSLSFVEANVKTFATTAKGVCMYNADYVLSHTKQQIAAVIVHEIHHLLNCHHSRCAAGSFNHELFNIAGDMEINDDLMGIWQLPDNPYYPATFKLPNGKTAEYYYSKFEAAGGHSSKQCGGCAGNPVPGEEQYDKVENGARTEAEMNAMRKSVAAAVEESVKKGVGNVPAGLRVWASVMLAPPTIPWQTKLRSAIRNSSIRTAGLHDFSWNRQNRRVAGLRAAGRSSVLLPGMDAPVPDVMVAVDTSASMGNAEAVQALSETAGIIRAVGNGVKFMSFDCSTYGVKTVRTITEAVANTRGGGGTNFIPVFEAVAALRVKPSLLIIATDGDGPFPAQKPIGYDVIWLLCGSCPATKPWGENIILSQA